MVRFEYQRFPHTDLWEVFCRAPGVIQSITVHVTKSADAARNLAGTLNTALASAIRMEQQEIQKEKENEHED